MVIALCLLNRKILSYLNIKRETCTLTMGRSFYIHLNLNFLLYGLLYPEHLSWPLNVGTPLWGMRETMWIIGDIGDGKMYIRPIWWSMILTFNDFGRHDSFEILIHLWVPFRWVSYLGLYQFMAWVSVRELIWSHGSHMLVSVKVVPMGGARLRILH